MRYFVTIADRTIEVELRGQDVIVDGDVVSAELQQVAGTLLRRLSLDGQSYRVVAMPGEARGAWDLQLGGERVPVEVVDERTRAIRAMTAHSSGPQGPKPVRAPMPGMVVRVEVEAGQHVRAGQGVVIIEAMKMENELKADAAGVVSKVLVNAGTAVEKGAMLIEFAAEPHG
jgi:biotin carboxyl carrier protein